MTTTVQNYAWSATNNAFYPYAFQADYNAVGSWPSDAVGVDDSVYNTYGAGQPPAGSIRGIDPTTKMPTWVTVASTLTLAEAQAQQIQTLSNACQAAIINGFTSSALGTAHTYPSKQTDQLNLTASVTTALIAQSQAGTWAASTAYAAGTLVEVNGETYVCTTAGTSGTAAPTWADATTTIAETDGTAAWMVWSTLFWAVDANAYLPHSVAQIQQVGLDGKAAIAEFLYQNNTLGNEVMAATTVAAVQAIVWPAS
jgi:hypothetical protein